jgi:hypothetical protein
MRKLIILTIVICLILSSLNVYAVGELSLTTDITTNESNTLFSDTVTNHWYYLYLERLVANGGINGYEDGTFRPDNTISNTEFVKIIIGIVSGNENNGQAHWAENYVSKATELGILLQDEYTIDQYDEPMKRQNMAKVVSRTLDKIFHESIVENTDEFTNKITDWETTCGVCKPDIAQAYAKGIICGIPDGSFMGSAFATRDEATTMIVRLIDSSYRVKMIGKIPYNEKTDLLTDGRMKSEKSKNYMDITLENLRFYKENGKYYVSCTFPELPDGFENWLTITTQAKENKPSFGLTTGFTLIEENKIPSTGTFVRELSLSSPSELDFIIIKIGVEAKNHSNTQGSKYSFTGNYTISTNYPNIVDFIKEDDTEKETFEYNFDKLFQW